MIEILHPVDDRDRIAELADQYDVVDAWNIAREELSNCSGSIPSADIPAPATRT